MMFFVAGIAVVVLTSLHETRSRVEHVADSIQPALHSASLLEYQLEKANSSLGLYLLGQESLHWQGYIDALQAVDSEIDQLKQMPLLQDQAFHEKIEAIVSEVDKYKRYRDQFQELAQNSLKNIPARALAAEKANPLSQRILQLISGMIQSEADEEASARRKILLMALEELRYARVNMTAAFRAFLAFRQQSAITEIQLYRESSEKAVKKIESHRSELNLDQEDSFAQYLQVAETFDANVNEVINIHRSDRWRLDSYLIRTEVGPLLASISENVQQFVSALREKTSLENQSLVQASSDTVRFVSMLLVLGLIAAAAISFSIVRSIVVPINRAVLAMQDIAEGEGDLTQRLAVQGNDEISQLASAFNHFASMVQDMVKNVEKYTQRVRSEVARLIAVTEETSRGADYQLEETDQVVTATTELAATVQEVARSATHASDAANEADEAAGKGRLVVGHTIESIDGLANEVERAATVIDRVEKDSESIGSVLDVIKGIAEQTNLLALNAAIEAARAGEQGRGFAVVADEVRTLASRTQQSTAEIQSMIERLQISARDAVHVMQQSRGKADSTVEQAARAGTSLEEINKAVAEINKMNTQIASAAHQQSAVVEEINHKISNISGITDQTAAGAQQSASATNELNQLAEQLHDLVKKFAV